MAVALAANNDWILVHLDVVIAFLNDDLKEVVYIEVPEGFCTSSTTNRVCILRKSLYGLQQAPKTWFEQIYQQC